MNLEKGCCPACFLEADGSRQYFTDGVIKLLGRYDANHWKWLASRKTSKPVRTAVYLIWKLFIAPIVLQVVTFDIAVKLQSLHMEDDWPVTFIYFQTSQSTIWPILWLQWTGCFACCTWSKTQNCWECWHVWWLQKRYSAASAFFNTWISMVLIFQKLGNIQCWIIVKDILEINWIPSEMSSFKVTLVRRKNSKNLSESRILQRNEHRNENLFVSNFSGF